MARVKRGVTTHARHKKVREAAKGSRGRMKNTFRIAHERVEKDMQYAYRDRRVRKRDFRRLWIIRINAAARQHGDEETCGSWISEGHLHDTLYIPRNQLPALRRGKSQLR